MTTEHDPLCDNPSAPNIWPCQCDFIARIREDQQSKAADEVTIASGVNYAHGYSDGYAKGRDSAIDALATERQVSTSGCPDDMGR